jgi:hypothetical protein
MNRSDLKKSQARKISESLFPATNYLIRLRHRMEELAFPYDDPLYLLVCQAHDAVNRLRLDTHRLSCDGMGCPSGGEG